MSTINAAQVKALRDRTGAKMMDCKRALEATDGDQEAAIVFMRKEGVVKAVERQHRPASEGIVGVGEIVSEPGRASMVEVNCETDFVARSADFIQFVEKVLNFANICKAGLELELVLSKFQTDLAELIAKVGENVVITRVHSVRGGAIGTYVHGPKIGVLVSGDSNVPGLLKDVAMHIAASAPIYVDASDVPADVIQKERQIQIEICMQSGKPQAIAEKMVDGRMRKFIASLTLTGQPFVKDPNITVGELLAKHGAVVRGFTRFELGESLDR